ncbi:conserved domain protein [Methylococcus capsulatus str. Bath]|uniref:Conserved domain protein n=1 Tax=Methylococcus capsulatus (strain ATCC 33009 / NCIMB 11132 / Bath) TaxID=243233 RepID=Q609J3_METCA|nr:hypothetical protein [Methylococcus capsulatus]AAU92482.1 conserved domain protein [Methylococcus capsulatus str. Bath]
MIEVADVDAAHRALAIHAPPPITTSWGSRTFSLRDPDGTAVCYLQWVAG